MSNEYNIIYLIEFDTKTQFLNWCLNHNMRFAQCYDHDFALWFMCGLQIKLQCHSYSHEQISFRINFLNVKCPWDRANLPLNKVSITQHDHSSINVIALERREMMQLVCGVTP